jgi:hypothetical protein
MVPELGQIVLNVGNRSEAQAAPEWRDHRHVVGKVQLRLTVDPGPRMSPPLVPKAWESAVAPSAVEPSEKTRNNLK